MTLKGDVKFKGELTCSLKNDLRNLVNFHARSRKSGNLHFDGLKSYVSAKKVQNYLSWQGKNIQTSKKNWLFVWKMTWEICWTLTRAVESLKIFTFMGWFWRKCGMFELKKYRWNMSWKMTFGFKNDISNWGNFHTSSWK